MTIAEVSRQIDISPDTLRYYERIGLIPPIKKNKSGIRDYGETDLKIEQRNQLAAKMEELKKTIDKLDYKIEVYEKAILKKEKELSNTEDLI